MTERDAKMIYAKGVMEGDRDTRGMSTRYKETRNENSQGSSGHVATLEASLLVTLGGARPLARRWTSPYLLLWYQRSLRRYSFG